MSMNLSFGFNSVLQPERIKTDQDSPGYNVKSDVWSLGITLASILWLSALQQLSAVHIFLKMIYLCTNANFLSTYVSRHSQGPSERKPMNYLGERGAWLIQGLPRFFLSTPLGKATNFKFCVHIHRIDRNKSPLKI